MEKTENPKSVEPPPSTNTKNTWEIAEEYCKRQLEIMDGSAEAGIKRLGTERFERFVDQVEKVAFRFKPKGE